MKIFYLSSSTIPSNKANSIQVMKMCDAFTNLGNEVFLFSKSEEDCLNNDFDSIKKYYNIKNSFIIYNQKASSLRLFGGLEYGYKVYKKIKNLEIKPDILYGRNLYALLACLKLNKPIIYESHYSPVLGKKSLENYLFNKPQFKRLVVINKALYKYYKNNFKIFKNNPEKILLAPDGAEISSKTIHNKSNNSIPVIGYAGSLYPGKGIETIIKIAERTPNLNYCVAGGTTTQINNYKNNNHLNNLFFKGYLKHSEIYDFLSQCDILIAPYSDKVFSEDKKHNNIADWMSPLKIFEYMASKKPIVASNLPAIKEILDDQKTALLVDYNNISEWERSIVKMLCKPDFANILAENAFEVLKNKYTWNIRAKRVLENIFPENSDNNEFSSSKNQLISYHNKPKTHINTSVHQKPVVLHIIGDLNVGGAERNMFKIITGLNNKKYKHIILTLFEPGFLAHIFREHKIEVISANLPRNYSCFKQLINTLQLIKLIRSINPSIIQTWLYHSNNLINIISPFIPKIPIINSIRHGNPKIGSFKTNLSARLGAYLTKLHNNTILYCSENSLKDHINIGYPYSKSFVLHNGFTIPEINKNDLKNELIKKLNIPEDNKIAIIVGRYSIEKDYPTLLKAIKCVIDNYPKIKFILCGKGLDNNNKELTSLINTLNINNHIILLGNQTEIEKLMGGSDFLISSSSSESFPNVVAEAMSVATPCIATNTGAASEIIGDTGILVPCKNISELSNAILKIVKLDNNTLKLIGEKARERIRENFSLDKTLYEYERLYKHIIENQNNHISHQ